jgi:predicted amidohydrolase
MRQDGKLRVGVAQVLSREGAVAENVAVHLDLIRRARGEGVDLLLFPELSLSGYDVGASMPQVALRRDAPEIAELAAASGPMTSVFGFVEEATAAQFHNSAVAVRNGEILILHRKLNLATYGNLEEDKHFAEGRYFETFALDADWRAGLLICADVWNPALTHLAMVHGTTLLLVPIASAASAVGGDFSNPEGWELAMRFYAMIYGVPILMANFAHKPGGEAPPFDWWGGSRIVDPFGRTLGVAGGEEELLVAELDYAALKQARYRLPTLRDSNLDLVVRELNRLSWQIGIPPESRRV